MIGIRGIAKKPIVDATAMANDIVSGKIAYCNTGRITGCLNLSEYKQVKQLSIPIVLANGSGSNIRTLKYSNKSYYGYTLSNESTVGPIDPDVSNMVHQQKYTSVYNLPTDMIILSIEVDGVTFDVSYNTKGKSCFKFYKNIDSVYLITAYQLFFTPDKKIYSAADEGATSSDHFTINYVEV